MPDEYNFTCPLCGGITAAPKYDDFTCSGCDVEWEYDEGHRLKLTDAMIAKLQQPSVERPTIEDLSAARYVFTQISPDEWAWMAPDEDYHSEDTLEDCIAAAREHYREAKP